MIEKIYRYSSKVTMIVLTLFVAIGTLSMSLGAVHANTHNVSETFDGQWKAVAGDVGLYGNATRFRVDGQVAWCLEPNKSAKPGVNSEFDFSQIGINLEQKKTISLIANFGYFSQPTPTNEILTGNLIWRYLGHTCGYVSSANGYPTMASQENWFNDVMNKVNRYGLNTSFDKTEHEISVGETVTLTDTNGVLQDMEIVSSDGLTVTKNGNQLIVTGTSNALDNAQINFKKTISNEDRDFVVRSGNSQALSVCKVGDPLINKISFKVNKNYQVAFNGNGATTGSMENQTFLVNESKALSPNAFTKKGHTFVGWNTKANGTGTDYTNNQVVSNLAKSGENITLYAKWHNTKPVISAPKLPNPLPTTNSNIPPKIRGNKVVIQKGDSFNAKDYFTASDVEDGNITPNVIITNNKVPLDKNNITIKEGEYSVTAKVTDSGGLSAETTIQVIVNAPPTITTPVLPNPLPSTPSNIPPLIDGGTLVIQKGDKFVAKDYFTADDFEDGNITKKIEITKNPVPRDKNNNTTKEGTYIVKATVKDSEGLSANADLKVLVNDPPKIKAEDRYFLQDQIVDKKVLLEQVIANDFEDGDLHDKVVIDYIKYHDDRVIKNPTSFDTSFKTVDGKDDVKQTISEIQYTVQDKYGKSATTKANLYINRDIQKFVAGTKKFTRYISLKDINTLDSTSIWKINPTLKNRLLSSLNKTSPNQAKAIYSYTSKDVKNIKIWLRNNKPSASANKSYVTKYLNPHKTKGSVS